MCLRILLDGYKQSYIDSKMLILACSSVKWSVKRLAPSFSKVTKEIVYLCPNCDLKGNSDSTINAIGIYL